MFGDIGSLGTNSSGTGLPALWRVPWWKQGTEPIDRYACNSSCI